MQGVNTDLSQSPAGSPAAPLDAAQLAEAFALFSRASEELSTAYNALQAQVGQLTERLTVLMGALPAAVVVVDRAGDVVQVNRAAEALFGGALVGRAWQAAWARLQPTETPGELTLVPEAVAGGEEPRRLSVSESALESGDERIVLLHDITDTHRMRLASERNERLAAMGEMVAGLAHQLRTPLAAALLYTGNLRQPELDPAQRASVADRALERLRYLERLIRDMLLFARGDSLGRQRFGVCDLAAELVHTLEPLAKARQIVFEAHCGCRDTELVGDRKALGGALTNLLENAIQASEAGSRVRFDVALLPATASGLGVAAVRFEVSDEGRGIAPELQERLFEPFFTTRAEGTGLGLAIARGVARAHGGDILLRSAPGQGSTFTLGLPLSLNAPAGSPSTEPTSPPLS
ncbi:Flagellar sensor histidine kinase fleS [Thauera humireducens]|uniref:sensor histidine kinase n=1 Tax=Thauera humireducens TaxID=1134435 RepID=UPI002467A3A6|nr:ATP-binding protein [Thauera humireducens]CAH1745244.1 Flagellar sensor histidine kinase fleS [Thauera humireducens]